MNAKASGCQQQINAGMTNSALLQLIYKRRTSSFSSSILKSILTTTPRPVVLNKTSSMEPAIHADNDNYYGQQKRLPIIHNITR